MDQYVASSGSQFGIAAVGFVPMSGLRKCVSFERGAACMGTQPIAFPPESLDKPEDPLDVAGCPARWVDLAVERRTGIGSLNEGHQRGL